MNEETGSTKNGKVVNKDDDDDDEQSWSEKMKVMGQI